MQGLEPDHDIGLHLPEQLPRHFRLRGVVRLCLLELRAVHRYDEQVRIQSAEVRAALVEEAVEDHSAHGRRRHGGGDGAASHKSLRAGGVELERSKPGRTDL